MQGWRFVLLDLIAAGVWAACFYSPAAATESGPAPDSEALDARVSNVTPKLDVWPACSSRESLAYADRICIKEGNHPDRLATYKIVFGLLHAGVRDSAALCVLDNSIIQSLNECFDSNSGKKWDDFTYVGLASLMHQLARNWR